MKVDLCVEGMNTLVRAELKDDLKSLRADLKRRKRGEGCAIFHMNQVEDVKELQRHIDAFTLVLRYYGGV